MYTILQNEDLKKIIFSYYPKRCLSCRHKITKNFSDLNSTKYKLYWSNEWKYSQNYFDNNYCNWCCYYVFNHFN